MCWWWHDHRRDAFPTLKFGVVLASLAHHLLREEPFFTCGVYTYAHASLMCLRCSYLAWGVVSTDRPTPRPRPPGGDGAGGGRGAGELKNRHRGSRPQGQSPPRRPGMFRVPRESRPRGSRATTGIPCSRKHKQTNRPPVCLPVAPHWSRALHGTATTPVKGRPAKPTRGVTAWIICKKIAVGFDAPLFPNYCTHSP